MVIPGAWARNATARSSHALKFNDRIGTLQVRVVRGRNLLNRQTLGCSDPYIRIVDARGNLFFSSEAQRSTQQPDWPNTFANKTSLRIYSLEGNLRVQAWDKNAVSDDPLGEVAIPVADAIGYAGEVNFQLHPRDGEDDDVILANQNSLGVITLHFRFDLEPLTSRRDLEIEPYTLPGMVEIRIHSAVGLKNREATGTSDPYVRVFGPDGSRVLKTPKCPGTLDPVWTGSGLAGSVRVKHASTGNIVFQVWDSNSLKDELMGEVQVPVLEAVKFGSPKRRVPLILRPRDREEDAFLATHAKELGSLIVEFHVVPEVLAAEPDEPPGTLTIAIDGARDLFERRFVGKITPFIRILDSSHKVILESPPVTTGETRSPEFREATTSLRVYDLVGTFTIQVWDQSRLGDSFLGEVRVKNSDALRMATEPESTLPLVPRMKESDSAITRHMDALGCLIVQFRFRNEAKYLEKLPAGMQDHREPPGQLAIQLDNCRGLGTRSDFDVAPYVRIIDPLGNEVLKTKPQKGTVDPSFDGEEPTIMRLAHREGIIKVQVWDRRALMADDLLGEVIVTADMAIHYSLLPRCKFLLRPREREQDKWLLENENRLGEITMSFTFEPDQTPVPDDVDIPEKVNGVFSLTVVGCSNLCNFEAMGTSDPYVKVFRNRSTLVHELKRQQNTLDPKWEMRNTCDVVTNAEMTNTMDTAIAIQVWDRNALIDELMGEALLPLDEAIAYASLARSRPPEDRIISIPLRVPKLYRKDGGRLMANEHKLGTVEFTIEFIEGDDKKTAAEVERQRLFTMDMPLEYVIQHIDRAQEASHLSRELVLYIPFLVMFVFFSLARRDTLQEHYIAGAVAQQFTSHEIPPTLYNEPREQFNGLHHLTAWWDLQVLDELHMWIQGVIAPHFWDWRHPHEPSKTYGPSGFNKAIGAIRFRARRMRPDSCKANPAFIPSNTSAFNLACFSDYDENKELTTPLTDPNSNFTVTYAETCPYLFVTVRGDLHSYPCGGYVVDIPLSSSFNQSLSTMVAMQSMAFVNETDTRFFIIEWFTYNPTLDMFTGSKYFIEITNGGGWILSAQIRSFRCATGGPSSFFFVYDVFFTIFVAYYWIKFFRDWVRYYHRTKLVISYLISVWSLLEIANLVIFIVALVFQFEWYRASFAYTNDIPDEDPDQHPEKLNYVMNLFYGVVFANAANSVLSFLKILKFLKMNSKLNILTRTMGRAAENIVGVLLIFFLIMAAYALAGVQLYGASMFEFRDVGSAMSSLFRALMGDFDYEELRVKNRATTFFYFWSFIILGLFVMLNFITAIIGSAYEQEQDAERTLPMAIQIRRTLRDLKALSPRLVARMLVNTVLRIRRHPDDIIAQHMFQYRLSLLQRDNIDETKIRRGEESAPDYLINHFKFKRAIPRADIEYITEAVVDNAYMVIAEDYCTLHHDEEREHEEQIAVVYREAINTGFRRVLVDRFEEIQAVQHSLLTGAPTPKLDAKAVPSDLNRLREDTQPLDGTSRRKPLTADPWNVSGGSPGKPPQGRTSNDNTGARRLASDYESQDTTEIARNMFDPAASVKKLFAAVAANKAAPTEQAKLNLLPPVVKESQRQVAHAYLETHVGGGRGSAGLSQVRIEAEGLDAIMADAYDLTCVRTYAMLDGVSAKDIGRMGSAQRRKGRRDTASVDSEDRTHSSLEDGSPSPLSIPTSSTDGSTGAAGTKSRRTTR
jgi:hypothetical protein